MDCVHLQIHYAQQTSHKTGQFIIGHIGWYGVLQPPFFIGSISRGRTVKQTILGGYVFGVGSTLISFIVLGNYSMGLQMHGMADFMAQYAQNGDLYGMIVNIIKTLPCAPVVMVVVLLTMIAFYATSFDSIALTASCYCYHKLEEDTQPNRIIQLMWCILLILLPIALLFAQKFYEQSSKCEYYCSLSQLVLLL